MANFNQPYQIAAATTQVAQDTTIANTAIPVASGGGIPRFLLMVSDAEVHYRPNNDGTEATTTLSMLPPNTPIVVSTGGFSHIRMDSPTGTANVFLTPLDNGPIRG